MEVGSTPTGVSRQLPIGTTSSLDERRLYHSSLAQTIPTARCGVHLTVNQKIRVRIPACRKACGVMGAQYPLGTISLGLIYRVFLSRRVFIENE